LQPSGGPPPLRLASGRPVAVARQSRGGDTFTRLVIVADRACARSPRCPNSQTSSVAKNGLADSGSVVNTDGTLLLKRYDMGPVSIDLGRKLHALAGRAPLQLAASAACSWG
jgi:hypothetical protein